MSFDDEAITAGDKDKNNLTKMLAASESPGPKRNLGRSHRRRRKKLLEIQRAEEELLVGSIDHPENATASSQADPQKSTTEIIPTDRNKIWPGVQERRKDSLKADASNLTAQLGYIPGNAIHVAARVSSIPALKPFSTLAALCRDMPVVLQLYPIAVRDVHLGGKSGRKFKSRKRTRSAATSLPDQDDSNKSSPENDDDDLVVEPFPTLYWLTHPLLRTLVSKLELNSMGIELEKRLKDDPEALASMERAHKAYGQERYDWLTPHDVSFIERRKWQNAFSPTRGVAGIRNYASIKCLHAHVAHYLSGGKGSSDNIVGRWVMDEVASMILKSEESLPVITMEKGT